MFTSAIQANCPAVSRQKCSPAPMKHDEEAGELGGGCGNVWQTPALQAVECLVRSASGSPLLLRKSLNANESQISLMGRVPPYLGRPGTQVPACQLA